MVPDKYLNQIPVGNWANYVDAEGIYHLIAVDCNRFLGTASFCKSRFHESDSYGELVSLYCLPAYMGKGYGKKLLKAALCELEKQGYQDIHLWVLEENVGARHFYERNGLMRTEEVREDEIGGKKLRVLQYCCPLGHVQGR